MTTQAAINSCVVSQGGDPAGVCLTIVAMGGTDGDLLAVASGADPSLVLSQVAQGSHYGLPSPVPTDTIPTASLGTQIAASAYNVPLTGGLFGPSAADINDAVDTAVQKASSIGDWFSAHWILIIAAIGALLLLGLFVFGAGYGFFK